MNITYLLLVSGLAYIGKVSSEDETRVILDDCLRIDNVNIPMPAPNGVQIRSQPHLLPVDHLHTGPVDGMEIPSDMVLRRIDPPLSHPLVAHYVKITSRIELPT